MAQNASILSNPLFFKTYLHLGNHKCFTNPKVHTHLLGTRYIHEVFSITKLRIQIMQLYPMIQQMIVNKTQFLFASINPDFTGLLIEGANMCKMLISTHRWQHGFLTSNLLRQSIYMAHSQATRDVVGNYWDHINLSNNESVKKFTIFPTAIFIPDIKNNGMILKEANVLTIPIIGLVNNYTFTKEEITYPIYGNDSSLKVVRFVTLLIASLIVKAYATSNRLYRYTSVIKPLNKSKIKGFKKIKNFKTSSRKNIRSAKKHPTAKASVKFLANMPYLNNSRKRYVL